MREVLLQGRDITKVFPGIEDPVLNHISLELFQGDFTVIMGPSGAGKSTLLYALCGMEPVTNGKVSYRETDLSGLSERQMAALRAKAFGFVFQSPDLISNLTIEENVAVAGYLDKSRSGARTRERAKELLEKMGIGETQGRFPSQVSGGEAQRAALARAVVNLPELLFADEPTGALNRKNSEAVLDIMTALNREGQSILMVTHDVRAAVRGNRILYLEDGRILDELELETCEMEKCREREEIVSSWLSSMAW